VSGEFLTRVGCGDIKPKPGIQAYDGDNVVFTDGSREKVDVIIFATGYKISFPFFDQAEFLPKDNRFPLWKRMMQPGVDNLFFMGLAQPLPTLVNFPEQQSKLVARFLAGRYARPSAADMAAQTVADDKRYLGHFYDSPRHTIQIDFTHYVADLLQEIARGEKRAIEAGGRLPIPPRAGTVTPLPQPSPSVAA
jgi:Flavin-binding monooxygenase-like